MTSRSTPDRPISVGDLVIYVHSHCGGATGLGKIYEVEGIEMSFFDCSQCQSRTEGLVARVTDGRRSYWAPPSWFRRIPPLPELEGEKRDEVVNA